MKPAKLLFDTDALVNLIALQCLDDALACLGFDKDECRRLPAAPYMLQGGQFQRRCPGLDSQSVAERIREITPVETASSPALESALNDLAGMDEGEILLIGAADQDKSVLLMTGDLRSLQSLGNAAQPLVARARASLRHRVIYFPQILLALASRIGLGSLDQRWRTASLDHKSLAIIFGTSYPQQWKNSRPA